MGFACCLHCGQEVRLPNSLGDVWVQCPRCDARYPLRDLMSTLPPSLVIVPPPESDRQLSPVFDSTLESPLIAVTRTATSVVSGKVESKRTPGSSEDDAAVPRVHAFRVSAASQSDLVEPIEVPSPTTLRADRRNTRMQRNRLVPLKIGLGGIAGLLLGQLVLWWLPAPYRADPLQLAPKLPSSLAFVAPAALRAALGPPPRRAVSTPAIDVIDPPSDDATASETTASDETASDETASDETASDAATTDLDAEKVAVSKESRELILGLANAPRFQLAALRDARDKAVDADRRHRAEEIDAETWYSDLSELAYRVTFANAKEAGIDEFARQVREFLLRIVDDQHSLDELGRQTRRLLGASDSNRAGLAILGDVIRVHPVGELFQTEIELAGDPPSMIHLVSRVDPRNNSRATYDTDDRVLILGVVITEPSLYLLGYQGNADVVVLGGFPINLGHVELPADSPVPTTLAPGG